MHEVDELRAAGEPLRRHAANIERPPARRDASPLRSTKPSGCKTVRDVDLVEKRRLEHDDDVWVRDRVVTADRRVVDARERAKRRTASLGPVLRERLDALAGVQQRRRVELRRGLRTLSGARMPANLSHAQPRPRNSWTPRAAIFASRTASTTVAPPFVASPAAKYRGLVVAPVTGSTDDRPCSSSSPSIQARNSRARPLADRLDDRVGGEQELGAGNLLGPAPAARVGLAEPRTPALDGFEPLAADETERHGQPLEVDAFLARPRRPRAGTRASRRAVRR